MKTKDIKITVHGQTVAADATAALLSGSRNLYRLAFEFDEPAAAARYVHLEKAGVKSVYLPIDEKPIAVPNEFYETEGVILVSVFADDLITTNAATLPVIRSAYSAAVPAEGADEAGATHKCVFTPTDETAVTVLKKDAEGFKAFCGGEYVRVGSANDYTDADKALVSLIPSKADETDLEDCIETVGEILRDKVDKVDGKGLSTNDFTDIEKVFLEEMLPQEIERIDAKIAEVEQNAYSNFKNKVDKENGKGLSSNDFTTELKDKLDGLEAGANKTVVDEELSSTSENPVQNKAVAAALDKKIDEPTGSGLIRKDMSGVYGTVGIDTEMPTSPTDNSVPSTKLLKEKLKNVLRLSDEDLHKTGLLYQTYQAAGSTPGTVGVTGYTVIQRDTTPMDDTPLGTMKIPSSYTISKYVKEKIAATTPSINESGNWVIGTTDTGVSAKGVKGDKGDKGDTGAKGADGKTPVKGTDYFTEADKQELVNAVIAALPNGNGVEY